MRRAVGAVTGASSLFVCTPGVRCSRPRRWRWRAAARVTSCNLYPITAAGFEIFASACFHPHFSKFAAGGREKT